MSRNLAALKLKPVPKSADVLALKSGYREETPIAFNGPLAQERCVEARDIGIAGANHYNLEQNPPYYLRVPGSVADLYVRRSVAARLREVNTRLVDIGLELFLYDAWRPQAIQR